MTLNTTIRPTTLVSTRALFAVCNVVMIFRVPQRIPSIGPRGPNQWSGAATTTTSSSELPHRNRISVPGEGVAWSVYKPLSSEVQSNSTTGVQAYLKEFAIHCHSTFSQRGVSPRKFVRLRSVLIHSF